jgi:aspartate racemase
MKTIGLLGGMSWESTELYYRAINEAVKQRMGGLHSASIAMVSVDFEPLEQLQHAGEWGQIAASLCDAARRIEAAGADFLVICTNTMHRVAPDVEESIGIPLLHIADATAAVVKQRGISTVGLLGTRFTMEETFYRGRLTDRHALQVLTPEAADRELVHQVIYQELCLGTVREPSQREFLRVVNELAARGAQAVILGCTEIGMLLKQNDTDVPLIDTTAVHARQAVDFAICG